MKRIFLLGVVATVMFSMAACNNGDSDVGVNARRAEAPRQVEVTVSGDNTMAIVSWRAGDNSSASHQIVRRMEGNTTIVPIDSARYVNVGHDDEDMLLLPQGTSNPMRGGTFSFVGETNRVSFAAKAASENPLDWFSAVILLPFEEVGGASQIGVRSTHIDAINASAAYSDIRWNEENRAIPFAAASAFRPAMFNYSLPEGVTWNSGSSPSITLTRDSGTDINLATAIGISVRAWDRATNQLLEATTAPTFTLIEWQATNQNPANQNEWNLNWRTLPSGSFTVNSTSIPSSGGSTTGGTMYYRAIIRYGQAFNSNNYGGNATSNNTTSVIIQVDRN